jgi:hypothetical protein
MPGAKPYTLRHALTHPLARMLPLLQWQGQVYRMGEKHPPSGDLPGHGPDWEVVTCVLAARDTTQVRVNLQRDYTLMAITTSSTVTDRGGFRAQFYDTRKQLRFADRGVNRVNIAGSMGGGGKPAPSFLREPWRFDEPDSQILVVVQNFETVQNEIQIAFYGLVLRFNDPHPGAVEFPGGPVSSLGE